MTAGEVNNELVDRGDVDELVRQVDRWCAAGEWDGLVDLRVRCRAALERGKQLWPVASLVEYRLALEAPASYAAGVLEPGAGRLALGPLPEVAASSHGWNEIADFIPVGPLVTITAHERVVRGDDLSRDERLEPRVLELPAALAPWEPMYPLAEYERHTARFPAPPLPDRHAVDLPAAVAPVSDPMATGALLELCRAWTSESNGRAEAVAVEGDAMTALATLGPPNARVVALESADAMAWMAWVGASGGAHGRRRGMAHGRFGAWWAAAALTGLLDDWPPSPAELGRAVDELRWFAWDAWEPDTGWRFHLAVDDPGDGLAWAVAATDAA
jgi:hypothetical protein